MSVAISARYADIIARPHRIRSAVHVMRDQRVVAANLPILSGQITVDRTQPIRRSVQHLVVVDRYGVLVPGDAGATLAPYGNELHVYAGVDYQDGTTETFSMGVFPIAEDSIVNRDGHTVTINAFDRFRHIQRNKYTSPFYVPAAQNLIFIMEMIIGDRLANIIPPPGIFIDQRANTSVLTTTQVFKVGDDGLKKLNDMAASIGVEVYAQRQGWAVIAPIVDLAATPPQWQFVGGTGGNLLQVTNDVKNDPGFNGSVIDISSSSNTAPIHSEAWDTDPNSPTYYLGRYGRVAHILSSGAGSNITSQAQADAATAADLILNRGATQTLTLLTLPNLAVDEGDVAYVKDPVSKVDGNYIISGLTIELGLNAQHMMQVVCTKVGALFS